MVVCGIAQTPNDEKYKAGQSPQQFAKVVANSAHQGINSVANFTLQKVSFQPVITLEMSNCWLDRTAPFQHFSE